MTEESNDVLTLVRETIDATAGLLHNTGRPDGRWTSALLQVLALIGRSHGCYVAGGLNANQGEWLFDQCWYRCGQDDFPDEIHALGKAYVIEEVTLALESEWHRSRWELMNDFLKLEVSIAVNRVMIFQADRLSDAENEVKAMLHYGGKVGHRTAANYLFAAYCFDVAGGGNRSPICYWHLPSNGPLVPLPPA